MVAFGTATVADATSRRNETSLLGERRSVSTSAATVALHASCAHRAGVWLGFGNALSRDGQKHAFVASDEYWKRAGSPNYPKVTRNAITKLGSPNGEGLLEQLPQIVAEGKRKAG